MVLSGVFVLYLTLCISHHVAHLTLCGSLVVLCGAKWCVCYYVLYLTLCGAFDIMWCFTLCGVFVIMVYLTSYGACALVHNAVCTVT